MAEFPDVPVDIEVEEGEDRLLGRARAGDIEAFSDLFERYRPALFGRCMRVLRDRALSEDIVQDTFLRAFRNLDAFDPSRPMWPWLATIAHRLALNAVRDRRHTDALGDDSSDEIRTTSSEPARDLTVEAVSSNETAERLKKALRRLPDRQSRVLLLHALEGWSHSDIAAAERTSISSVKSTIYRARIALRKMIESGLAAVFVAPGRLLHDRLGPRVRAARDRVRAFIDDLRRGTSDLVGQSILLGGQNALAASILAATVVMGSVGQASQPIVSATDATAPRRVELVSSLASNRTRNAQTVGSAQEETPGAGTSSMPEDVKRFADYALDPTADASPDNTQFESIVVSSEYSEDHTIYAAGTKTCPASSCYVLFASEDGGTTWRRVKADGFRGYTLLLPPGQNATIFAMSQEGLQKSADRGESFVPVSPVSGRPAMSPTFGEEDQRILIAGAALMEYSDDTGRTEPSSILAPAAVRSSVAFSPTYREDRVVMVGTIRPDPAGNMLRSAVYRCGENGPCVGGALPDGTGAPQLRLSPRFSEDGVVYAFGGALFRSTDGAMNWVHVPTPPETWGGLFDVALWRNPSSGAVSIFLAAAGGGDDSRGGVYRSDDDGRTWTHSHINLDGLRGVSKLTLIDSGSSVRILAGGSHFGIACSDDLGATWSKRCPGGF